MKILIVGDSVLDHYIWGSVSRQSPEDSNVPIVDLDSEEFRLGGCLNVAANIRSLQPNHDIYVSSILKDECLRLLHQRGILGTASCYIFEEPGIIKTRIVNTDTGKQIARLDTGKTFDKKTIFKHRLLFRKINPEEYDAIIVSDYDKGIVNSPTIKILSGFDIPVFVDTKKSDLGIWNNIKRCIIKINEREWNESNKNSIHPIIITKGEEGAELRDIENNVLWFPIIGEKIENPEVTGCGDVFLAGFVIKYLETKNIHRAIEFANKVASESVKYPGTTEISL